jgi:hypothetical protein
MAPARGVTTVDAALAAATEIGYPVALKASGIERLARSESGGVALDIQGPEQLRGAYERMSSDLGAGMAEAVVQQMVRGGVETIVAMESHPAFGPVIGFGLGGAFADAIADRLARRLPHRPRRHRAGGFVRRRAPSTTSAGTWLRSRTCWCGWGCWSTLCPRSTRCASTRCWSTAGRGPDVRIRSAPRRPLPTPPLRLP